jgi:2-deoxy-D-gluconate 3-dehydrogenase
MDFSFDNAFDLTGQVALITGGAGGIATCMAELFAERGATLVLVDRTEEVHKTARSIGSQHLALVGDVADEASVKCIVAESVEKLGRIDILVNNAGIGPLAKAEETSAELWDATMAVNLRGSFLYAREVGKQMIAQGGGRIVNMASQAALVALDGHLAYCASKAAVLGMNNVLAMEWGPLGITVNAISPTVVESAMGAEGTWAGERGENFKQLIPTRRFAQPEEIAMAALYLVSGAAGMINGENLIVDGGYTAT